MVALTNLRIAGRIAGTACVAIAGTALLPAVAFANDSSVDIAAPLRAAAATGARPSGDQEFRQLFASWRSMDRPASNFVRTAPASPAQPFTPAAASFTGARGTIGMPGNVSIPSRMPVDSFKMTSGFGMRWHPILGGRRQHKGIDLSDPTGTPVYATADGIVGRADRFSGYGLYIQIEHGGNLETRYGHLSRLNVAAGQSVHKGDLIGLVGATGRATGPHLHYEVRIAGVAVNPVPYMYGQATPSSVSHDVAMIRSAAPASSPAAAANFAEATELANTAAGPVTTTATATATEIDGDE